MNHNRLLNTYLVVSVIYLIGLVIFSENFNFFAKPLLMPWLFMAVLIFPTKQNKVWLYIALMFSWIGDVVLLFANFDPLYFIVGLISFLLAHITYILAFKKITKGYHPQKKLPIFFFLLLLAYLIIMWILLFPTLGEMKIPVTIYSIVITSMLATSIYVDTIINSNASKWLIIGAISFVISDSLLAFNKFHTPFAFASISIMSTYLFAQYALVRGFLKFWS